MRILVKRFNWHWLIAVVAIIIFALAAKSLYHTVHNLNIAQMKAAVLATPPQKLLIAAGIVVAAYALLSVYDFIAIRYLGEKLPYRRILNASCTAYAIGHTLGVAMLSAGAVRFRYYGHDGIKNEQIANIIMLVSLAFGYGTLLVIGVSLVVNPHMLSQLLTHIAFLSALAPIYFRITGLVMLCLIMASFVFAGNAGRVFTFKRWSLRLPPALILIKLSVVAVADIALVVYLIHYLLPAGVTVSYLETFSAYVQSMTAGIVSHVPGGLGVFELTMTASLPQVNEMTLLPILLIFRILYYLIPFVFGMLSFFIHELYLRSALSDKPAESAGAPKLKIKAKILIPQLLGFATAALGAVMLILSILPPSVNSELLLQEFFPVAILESSYLLNTLTGFLLIVLAHGLYKRLNGAWCVIMWLLALSVFVSLLKGSELDMAVVSSCLLAALFLSRHYFSRHSTLMALRLNTQTLVLLCVFLISIFWLGMFVFRYEPYTANIWWQRADGGARFLRSSALLAILMIGYTFFSLIRFKKLPPGMPAPAELEKALAVVKRSTASVANLSLLGDKQLLFSDSGQSFIMYQIHGRSWIAMSDPVGDAAEFPELIQSFIELCYSFGGVFVFYEVSNTYRHIYDSYGIQLLKMGEEAVVNLDNFSLQGSEQAQFRQVLSRGSRDGLTFEVMPGGQIADIMSELRAVSDSWLAERKAVEKGFSLGCFDENYLQRFDCALVRYSGEIVAFANIWQSAEHHEAALDLMRYKRVCNPDGKEIKNLMDYLFIHLFMWAKAQGFHHFSLGMAPFTGIKPRDDSTSENDPENEADARDEDQIEVESIGKKWLYVTNVITKYGKRYYNFTGLRRFKDKYDPEWKPRYIGIKIGFKAGISPIRGLTDTTLLISGGMVKTVLSKSALSEKIRNNA